MLKQNLVRVGTPSNPHTGSAVASGVTSLFILLAAGLVVSKKNKED